MKIVNFDHSSELVLYSACSRNGTYRTFLGFTKWKKVKFDHSVSHPTRHAAEIGHTSHIFLGFEIENRQV